MDPEVYEGFKATLDKSYAAHKAAFAAHIKDGNVIPFPIVPGGHA